jgi:hypothetical protein
MTKNISDEVTKPSIEETPMNLRNIENKNI